MPCVLLHSYFLESDSLVHTGKYIVGFGLYSLVGCDILILLGEEPAAFKFMFSLEDGGIMFL